MTLQVLLGIALRHGLTAAGVNMALVTSDVINQVTGVIVTVIGLALSGLEKKKK